jgi:hypothetical protein
VHSYKSVADVGHPDQGRRTVENLSEMPPTWGLGSAVMHKKEQQEVFLPRLSAVAQRWAKSLILLVVLGCLQNGHSVETRVVAGFRRVKASFSTKLFTDGVDIGKKCLGTATYGRYLYLFVGIVRRWEGARESPCDIILDKCTVVLFEVILAVP